MTRLATTSGELEGSTKNMVRASMDASHGLCARTVGGVVQEFHRARILTEVSVESEWVPQRGEE